MKLEYLHNQKSILLKSILFIVGIIVVITLTHLVANYFSMQKTNNENLYWIFSASAQAIAAFFAFTLTGYSIIYTIMNDREQRDDSLVEVHAKLRAIYYCRLKWLSVLTGFVIIFDLLFVFINPFTFLAKNHLAIFHLFLNILVIYGGIWFVIGIIDPNKHQNIARSILNEEKSNFRKTGSSVDIGDFFFSFVSLEQEIRNLLRQKNLLDDRTSSFMKMITILDHSKMLTNEDYEELYRESVNLET